LVSLSNYKKLEEIGSPRFLKGKVKIFEEKFSKEKNRLLCKRLEALGIFRRSTKD